MAIIWADSFDHYGTGATGINNMLQRAWSQVGSLNEIRTTVSRTGAASLWVGSNTFTSQLLRRTLPGVARSVVGVAAGLFLPSLPGSSAGLGIQFRNSNSDGAILSFGIVNDGSIIIRRGAYDSANIIGVTDAGVINAGTFQHIEVAALIDPIVGWVEVRIEGVRVFRVEDVNTGNSGVTVVGLGNIMTSILSTSQHYWDDVVCWDDSGPTNNDFIGPARVTTDFAPADTDVSDWQVFGSSDAHSAVDDVPPDGDDTFIAAEDVGQRTEFPMPELPPEVVGILAVHVPAMGKIADAGIGRIRLSLVDDGAAEDGPEHALTPVYSYFGTTFQVNPNTGDVWTRSSYESALLRIEKTM